MKLAVVAVFCTLACACGSLVSSPEVVGPSLPAVPQPSPSNVPSPSPGVRVPSPVTVKATTESIVIPSPTTFPGPVQHPAPDMFGSSTTFALNMPSPEPSAGPAPTQAPAPSVIATEEPYTTHEDERHTHPAPMESVYSFCETALKCYDCDGNILSPAQQDYVNRKWNDTRCDDVRSTLPAR